MMQPHVPLPGAAAPMAMPLPAPAPARPRRTGLAVVGLLFALLAAAALALTLMNYFSMLEWQKEDGDLPAWVRAIAFTFSEGVAWTATTPRMAPSLPSTRLKEAV